ncbi:hypothetical protein ABIA24_001762 [Sinorhizobium fredii]|uniref:hypothetical protein n=1 Tax=Rhizobium fredii TaxID=380 RepID=UPI003515707A
MASMNTGGPAFPRPAGTNGAPHPSDRWENNAQGGMSLRDWFAGQALAGYLAADQLNHVGADLAAECAYRYADAMLAEREKSHG